MATTAKLDTKTIKAGDTIYIARNGSWSVHMHTAIADRVTPSGIVIVKIKNAQPPYNERRFSKDGIETGGSESRYRRSFLVTKDRYDEYMAENAERDATNAIRAAITATKDVPMAELTEALRKIQVMITTLETDKMLRGEK